MKVNFKIKKSLLICLGLLVGCISECKAFVRAKTVHLMEEMRKPTADINKIVTLICDGADPSIVNAAGQTALHLAAFHGKAEKVQLLVAHGVQVNARENEGRTALHDAVEFTNYPTVTALLKAGADPNIADCDGCVPLHLITYGAHVIQSDYLDITKALIDAGANVNTQTSRTTLEVWKPSRCATPLHLASLYNHADQVEMLLDAGADVMIRDANGSLARSLCPDEEIRKLLNSRMRSIDKILLFI